MSASPERRWGWWEAVPITREISQGDVLEEASMDEDETKPWNDLIVLTQDCDLQNGAVKIITLCPIYPIMTWVPEKVEHEIRTRIKGGNDVPVSDGAVKDWFKELVSGEKYLNMVALNDQADCEKLGYFVNLAEPVTLPRAYVDEWHANQKNGTRWHLLPPYREYLAQAFARMYSRVACMVEVGKVMPDVQMSQCKDEIDTAVANGTDEIRAKHKEFKDDAISKETFAQAKVEIAERHGKLSYDRLSGSTTALTP